MDNKQVISKLKCLREDYWDDDGYGHETKEYEDTMVALDMAIASLEAWDKIKEQIEEEKSYAHADYNRYKNDVLKFDPYYIDGDYPLPKDYFGNGMERAEDIINKHLGEVDG